MNEVSQQPESAACETKACGSVFYALSFFLPFLAVAASTIPSGKLGPIDLVVAALAGGSGVAIYRAVKWFRHRKRA